MHYKKLFSLGIIIFFTLFFVSCGVKKIEKPHVQIYQPPIENRDLKIDKLIKLITKNCNAIIQNSQNRDLNGSILVQNRKTYLKIDLNTKSDFLPKSQLLTQKSKQRLGCIIPFIKKEDELTILITGHADNTDNNKIRQKQHLSDNRAITVAELFFNKGITHEIYAKGCGDKKPKMSVIFGDNQSTDRRVEIYIYSGKSHIQDHCK